MEPNPTEPAGVGTLALITATVFGFATSVTMIGPLLLDLGREFGVPVGAAGLLATAMSLPWALGAPFAGHLSDKLGRRPLMVLALGGVGALSLASAESPSFAVLLLTRFLAGCFGAFGPAAVMASVGDLFPSRRRAMAMGWLNMGFSMAALVGVPLAGAIDGWFGWRWSFRASGLMLIVLAALVQTTFPGPRPTAHGEGVIATYRVVWGVPRLGNFLAANLVERICFFMTTLYLPAFLMLAYSLNAAEVAPALSLVALGNVAGNVAGGWLGERFSRPAIFVAAQLLAGGIALALFWLHAGWIASAALGALFGLANASSRPGILAFGADLVPAHRGAVLGLVGITNQGGVVLGSALGALVVGLGGYTALAVAIAAGGAVAAGLAVPLARTRCG